MNQYAKYLGHSSFSSKVLVTPDTNTHTSTPMLYLVCNVGLDKIKHQTRRQKNKTKSANRQLH